MDWETEAKKLRQTGERNWFKPKTGQQKVKFLSNGEEYEYEYEDDKGIKKLIQKVRFDIMTNEVKMDWGIPKGMTENSLYGQLVLIGKNKGTLIDQEITLVVKGSGKEVSYTVLEALPLMQVKEEVIK